MGVTLTNLIPEIYRGLDTVSRELTGFIPSVTLLPGMERVAQNQVIRSFIAPTSTAGNITPGHTVPDDGDQTIGNDTLTISKVRGVPIRWTGENEMSLSGSYGTAAVRQAQITQAIRTLTNEIETDLAGLHIYASRAYGTAGSTPFSSGVGDAAQVRRVLVDNGAPPDLQLVIDTTAGAAMRTNTQLTKANEAGGDSLLRQGVLLDLMGMQIRESAQVLTSTAGTGANATTDAAGYAVGATTITLASAGTGTVVAGDVVTFAGDSNKYVVLTGDTNVANGGTIVLATPGLRVAIGAAPVAITVVAAAARNLAFSRSAVLLATRLPAVPEGGDLASDRMTITDPRTGISMELSAYPGYRQIRYELAVAWGVKVIKPAHAAILLG